MKYILLVFLTLTLTTVSVLSASQNSDDTIIDVVSCCEYEKSQEIQVSDYNEDLNYSKIIYTFSLDLTSLNGVSVKVYKLCKAPPSLRPPIV